MKLLFNFFAFLALLCGQALAAEKPNVLFIAVDDLKPALGCYGDKMVKSPNIDRLAARGVVFDRAYCNQAVCAPSRNSLLTGRRPTTLGIYDLGTNFRKAAPDAVTLPQHFMAHGWRAEGLGKIFHTGHGNVDDAASWSVPLFREKTIAYALTENRRTMTREEALFANEAVTKDMARGVPVEAADVPDEGYPDGRIAAEAVRRLHAAAEKRDAPFFIAVGFLKPHLPFCAPKKYWDLYDRAAFALPERRTPPDGAPVFAPTNWGELRQYSDIPETGPLDDDQARRLIHGYHAATSYVDAQLGKVLDALEKEGLAEKTIIVLWGDHGWHLGDHGMWSKHTNYEQAARIPLIVAGPGIARGRAAGLVESVDLYPTLADLAALPAPAGVEGRSFAAALRDPSAPTGDFIMHCFPRGERIGRALRTAQFRLVEWKVPGAPADSAVLELYDYENDPLETKNLAAEKPEVVAKLRAILSTEYPEAKTQWTGKPKAGLDSALKAVAPGIRKWATVCVVTAQADGTPAFAWHDYADSGNATDFWPASAIKIYAAVAALELLNERGFPLDTVVSFEHRGKDGAWVLDCARTMREMLGEVFRRSSNEDYTLLLRLVGLDRINTQFLTPERGFPHSALMRGYVSGRPCGYVREEPQRITLRAADGRADTFEHGWSGRFYAEERGGKIIDARTGNVTSPRELAECLRRVLFAENIAVADRYRLTPDQLEFLRHGGAGLTGLETRVPESGPAAWKNGLEAVFPQARFFHKCGVISNYALEVACVDDSAASGKRFILVPVIAAGEETKPVGGEALIGEMSRAIGEWVKRQ